MKTIDNLNKDQILELKRNILMERFDKHGRAPSFEEMLDADILT